MVALPAPAEAPHAQTSVPVGGSVTFEAENVVACEADAPDLFRAYATHDALTIVGRSAGRATLRLRLEAGDEFFLDVDVTTDPPARRALAVGDLFALSLEGVKDVTPSGEAVKTAKSSDGAQLIVTAIAPGVAVLSLQKNDGSTQPVDILVVGGTRLF